MYARVVPNRGPAHPIQRLARVGAHPRIAALLSDDNRAIVAWSEQQGTQTSVYIDRSGDGRALRRPRAARALHRPGRARAARGLAAASCA